MTGCLFIDADACPVKAEAEEIASRHGWPMRLVTNGGIRPSANPLVQLVIVPEGPDMADHYIAAHAGTGDIVVTADIPLAARVIARGAVVLRPDGEALTAANIGVRLATRDLMTDLRAADPLMQVGSQRHAAFSRRDRSQFRDRLEAEIRKSQHGG